MATYMLSYIKKFVKQSQSDIILAVGVILIALISFGAGLLIDFSGGNQPIIIQNPQPKSGLTASVKDPTSQLIDQGKFVGSANSDKYHWPNCPAAKKIALENQIWFSSEQEAQDAGYVQGGNFEKYRP